MHGINVMPGVLNCRKVTLLLKQINGRCFSGTGSAGNHIPVATFGYAIRLQPQDHYLARNGVAHDGEIASRLGLSSIPVCAETVAIATALELVRSTAIKAFKAVDGAGLSRVDTFVTKDGSVMVNEINTMPGFTSISMYPKAWEATGVRYADLITMLIEGVLR